MSVVVFCGPSLPQSEVVERLPGAIVLGPVACGDLYRALRSRPAIIGVIDGYFDQRLSVWHKEILWALACGVRVVGAASMGALRAAELAAFGMQGIGRIFEWYRDGVIEDDDEVALTHESAQRDYAPLCEPMVNVRATLQRAVELEVISDAVERALIVEGKRLFYPDRRWHALVAGARATVPPSELERFTGWLQEGNRVDQKRLDALELIDALRQSDAPAEWNAACVAPSFRFEYTEAWHALRSTLDREGD